MLAVALLFPALLKADSFAPTAGFTITPSSGALSTTFYFDASASRDHRGFSQGLEYRWNFDYSSGNSSFTSWDGDPQASHRYTQVGEKTVALEARDSEGLTDRVFNTVNVVSQSAFSGWFTVSPLQGDTDTEFEFRASVATPGGQNTDSFKYKWDFNGDGIWDTNFSSSKTAFHTYAKTGYITPRLQIQGPGGEILNLIGHDETEDGEPSFVYVTFSNAPQASIAVSPARGPANATFYFDGSGSFDAKDGRTGLEYRWDFEGDGVFELNWGSEQSPTHRYEAPGTYEAMIQVRDTDGVTDEATVRVIVDPGNLAPEASFSLTGAGSLNAGDRTIGTTNTTFTFNASGSRDEETSSAQLAVRWDFDGDGTWDTNFSTQKTATTRYLDLGVYIVRLEVRDEDNQRDTAEQSVTIVANEAPLPAFTVTPAHGTPGTLFQFDATDSSDSQYASAQLQARWDWEGDGTWDTPFEQDKIVSHQYDRAGTYKVRLQIRDPEGAVSLTEQTVQVKDSTAPTARLAVDVASGTFSTLFHFDASASSDAETAASALWFRWDFNDTGPNDIQYDTSWSRSKTRTMSFSQPGDMTVRIQVKDEDGDIAEARVTISLHWASSYLDTLKSRGIIRGYAGGDLAPDRHVTRAELLKMVMEAAAIQHFRTNFEAYFSDVKRTDWFVQYVETAYEKGIASGYTDGTFRPNQSINRAEAMKLILQAFEVPLGTYRGGAFPDVSPSDWFASYVGTGRERGLLNGYADGFFRPNNLMTRAEAAKIIALVLEGAL